MSSTQPNSVGAPTEVNTVTTQPDAYEDYAVPACITLGKTGLQYWHLNKMKNMTLKHKSIALLKYC